MRTPLPERILNKPVLKAGLKLYYEAFWELSSERQLGGFGVGPIPWSSVVNYCQYHGMGYAQTNRMIFFINVLDRCFLGHVNKSKGQS